MRPFRAKKAPVRVRLNKGRRVFYASLLLAAVVPFMLLMLALLLYPVARIEHTVASLHTGFYGWRIALFIAVIGGWQTWTASYARWAGLNAGQRELLRTYRWRMALWLIVLEASWVQQVPVAFIHVLLAPGGAG